MSSDTAIREAIPAELSGMVQSTKFANGVATIIADAGGLGRSAAAQLQRELEDAVGAVEGVDEVRVALMADKVARQIIVVGSGKGGVGKSTLTTNLAVALANAGRKVGVVDADIYGPSQPLLLGTANEKIRAEDNTLIPTDTEFGVRVLSIGQLVEPGRAIAWRGPMVGQALAQLMEGDWGDVDTLLVDLPPGTGDVQLTMLQKFKPTGAVVVSTPQDLALIDATRAMDLFKQAQVPIIGLVENMAGYLCPECGAISNPFGQGGTEAAAQSLGVPFLGRVPLAMEIRVASDTGQPPAANETEHGRPFAEIAARLNEFLSASKG
ncbi:Mrp/NBP35 family ATP-binding protein [Aurantiacibacter poecillastricola]|uniref:Mrp/NBP35 family ATP-binding protein n=1 Tax=Aurantiacibacter poecillastricola TaxID=3064385 RepID=UPI00273D18A1|nr:Mrp/NBP35 family ATP-binding protein [Aurantiacibacter sp. 219JJ12-13]MDP5260129.1 Mrp/NBP35 family ATP-binding protein [Aurantiacibacter sp. 219JJ12-13]